MREALLEAELAESKGEVPVGCVIVRDGRVIARGHNLREQLQDPCAHAEVIAIREASRVLGTWRLDGCDVFVTLEPCPMCAGALVHARVARVVFATDDPKAGGTVSLYAIGHDLRLNHRFAQTTDVRRDEASSMLKRFFGRIREAQRDARAKEREAQRAAEDPELVAKKAAEAKARAEERARKQASRTARRAARAARVAARRLGEASSEAASSASDADDGTD